MSRFYCREDELRKLNKRYAGDKFECVVIYGRRRVGKTALINEFCRNKPVIFFSALNTTGKENLAALSKAIMSFERPDTDLVPEFGSYDAALDELTALSRDKRIVFVIDEYPYLAKAKPAISAMLQHIIDHKWAESKMYLILCGSSMSFMESQVLGSQSPLYGRRTAQICLKQISFRHYKGFFPGKKEKELIELYSVTGGVPKYIELIGKEKDIFTSVKNNVLERSSYLYDEPEFLLQQEVSEIGSYFSVIKSIASGNRKLSDIAASIGLKATGITKYLKTLIDLDLVEREVPVTESNPEKSKKGLYVIKDNYISFWFKFVYPYKSFIESGNADHVMEKIRQSFVQNHVSYVYEDICREKMQMMNMQGDLPFHFSKLGRYWDKNTEIDIVALDTDPNRIIFGECKYRKELMGTDVLKALEAKAKNVAWNKDNREEWFVLFSSSGFTKALKKEAEARKDVALYGGNEAV